jgi:cytochrome c553
MIRVLAFSAAAALLWVGAAFAQDTPKPDPAKGQKIVDQVCAACHGPHGNSVAPANPKLAGQYADYLHKQLTNFKAQDGKRAERENPIMAGMVANLSDTDMKNVAAYFSQQSLRPDVARDKNLAAAGQKLYRGGNAATGVVACAGCHGPTGAGIPVQYPHIAGQYAEYIETQLKAFRSGVRANDPNGMMRGVTARMTDGEIKALAQYVAGLR